MSTAAQQAANIANSRLSTGPLTEEGKAASSRNATRHGLTAKQVVIKGEDFAAFEALKADLMEEHDPLSTTEELLVTEIAENYWRLMRARRLEAAALERELAAALDVDSGNDLASAFESAASSLDKIRRYMVSIERAWHRALTQLTKLQADRRRAAFLEAEHQRAEAEAERADMKSLMAEAAAIRAQQMHDYVMAPLPPFPPVGFVSQPGLQTPKSVPPVTSDATTM